MKSFETIRDRDAWATIRGYVYQVDLTLDRWIELKENELLELERGEDIDIISEAISSSGPERNRILEQIKHRDKNITLRSSEAIEAMVSFYEHIQANTGKNLLFRFITNAKITTERPSLFLDKKPAILIWENLRAGTEKQIKERLKNIRGFLKLSSRPSAIGKSLWANWINFIEKSNDEELLNFIKKFEWSSSNTPFQKFEEKIQNKLVELHIVEGPEEGILLYQRLFLYVFKKLSQPGIKSLSKEELMAQKDKGLLDQNDKELLINLQEIWKMLDIRVHALEEKVELQKEQFSKIDVEFEKLKSEVGFQATIDHSVQRPALDIPIFDNAISRKTSVDFFIDKFQSQAWCAVYGDIGSGKTNLASLIANKVGVCVAWIRLRDLNPNQAALRIDDTLFTLSGESPKKDWNLWYKNVSTIIPTGSLIVMDDIPKLNGTSILDERLLLLVKAFRENGIKILSTSAHPLPTTLIQNCPKEIVENYEVPKFTKEELEELLIFYGAPNYLVENENFIALLMSLTEMHPVLLTAVARYLQDKQWRLDSNNIDRLFHEEYKIELNDLIQNQLLNKLEDESTRELLYRLTLIRGPFSLNEVNALSKISPVISSPFEKINKAQGLWIQKDTPTTYLVSPLLYPIGPLNLELETMKNTHFVLGESIIKKRLIHPIEGIKALNHFVSAEAYKEAAMTLISSLEQLEKNEAYDDVWGFSLIWYSQPLPEKMDLHTKMLLRTKQIMVLTKMKKDVTFLIQDLENMIEQSGTDDATANFISLYPALYYIDENPIKATQYLKRGLSKIDLLNENDSLDDLIDHPVSMIWITGFQLNTSHEIFEWLEMISAIPRKLLERAANSQIAPECCMKICDQIWLGELKKEERLRDWNHVINCLEKIADLSKELGLKLLWACAVRAQIIILAEYKDDLKEASRLAVESLDVYPSEATIRFLIEGIIGKQYVFKGRYPEAITHLTESLKPNIPEYPTERINCYVQLSKAFGDNSPEYAVFFTNQALEIAKQNYHNQEDLIVKVLGEHIVALWLAGEQQRIYPYYEEMVVRLLNADKSKDNWKILFVGFGHVSGYLSSVISTGKPPADLKGGETYTAPTRGFFIIDHPLLVNVYQPANDWFLASHLSMVAEALGLYEQAEKWMVRSFDLGFEKGNKRSIGLFGPQAIDYLIRTNNFAVALDIAIETETILELYRRGADYQANAEVVIGKRTDKAWGAIEESSAELAIIPAIFSALKKKFNNPIDSIELSEQIISICKQMQIVSPIPVFWNNLAGVIELIFSDELTLNQYMELSKGYNERSLQFLCYLGATLVALPADALNIYKAVQQFIEGRYKSMNKMYGKIILPFIMEYWTKKFNENRFRFSYPDHTEKRLNKCKEESEEKRLSEVINIIGFGLNII